LIPYRGTGPAMQDLVANQIQVMVDQSSNSLPQVRADKIKAFGITAKTRSPAAPEIPTTAEMAPAAFTAFHKEEYERWKKILLAANVKVE
jgi:tripartite-type tricarboxylate transporter receptor subunit TctC